MPVDTIGANQNTTQTITANDSTLILRANITTTAAAVGINVNASLTNVLILVENGSIDQQGTAVAISVSSVTDIFVSALGTVLSASTAIQVSSGPTLNLVNRGYIFGTTFAVAMTNNSITLQNYGEIASISTVIRAGGNGSVVNNYGTLRSGTPFLETHIKERLLETISETRTVLGQVELDNGADRLFNSGHISANSPIFGVGGNKEIVNEGTLRGLDSIAIDLTGTGDDTLDNTGSIFGAVSLGGGDDDFRNFGSVHGDVSLGDNDDYFDTQNGIVAGGIDAGAGDDEVTGNDANNDIAGGANADEIIGRGGADLLSGDDGDDTLDGGAGGDRVSGGAGIDTITFELASGGVVVSLTDFGLNSADAAGDTYEDVENIVGSFLADSLSGNGDANAIEGGSGNDTLNGNGGADTLSGDEGNDTYVTDGGDTLTEGAGEGTDVVLSSVSFILGANFENLTLTGSAPINGTGNSGANTIIGNTSANIVNGAGGSDRYEGGAGNDNYVTDGADTIVEAANAGTDTVQSSVTIALGANLENLFLTGAGAVNGTGNTLSNALTGNAAANTLNGSTGNDSINGGSGNDRITGSTGNDTLTGGANNDIFVFENGLSASANLDRITDFNAAQDLIHLQNSIFTRLTKAGTLGAAFFELGTRAGDADDYIIYNKATGALLYDADGTGARAAIQFAVLSTKPTISAADFVVI